MYRHKLFLTFIFPNNNFGHSVKMFLAYSLLIGIHFFQLKQKWKNIVRTFVFSEAQTFVSLIQDRFSVNYKPISMQFKYFAKISKVV